MLANLHPPYIITRREIRDQLRDWRIIVPIVVLTVFFPMVMNFTADQLIRFVERYGAPLIGDRLIPFLLMVVGFFPISVSLVIALESFVGEKERHSIEPLLSAPLSDWQLYLGKLLASIFTPLMASYLGIAVYLVSVYRQVGWVPERLLLVQILALTTVQALVMVSGAVVVSTQTTSVRAANLLASFIIIPMTFLIQGESIIMFWGRYEVLWWIICGQIIIAGLLVRTGVAHFNREELLGRELDTLNLRWGWRTFWKTFVGQARSPLDWYRREVGWTLRRLAMPAVLVFVSLALGMLVGGAQAGRFVLPAGTFDLEQLNQGVLQGLESFRIFSVQGVSVIWLHNLRVILLATILGVFSFGVLGLVVLMAPLMLVGYFATSAAAAGHSPWTFLAAFVLPHGVLEIPAIILAGAIILRLGATLASPAKGRTLGEAWLLALADWGKIVVALILPLLLGAAVLEVFVTPRVVLWFYGN